MKRIVTFIMAVIMIAALANPSTVDAATNAKLSKTKVTLSITDKKKNPSVTLKVKKASKRAAKKAKWTTSNKKVASVSKKGKITAKKPGKATIICKVSGKKLKCRVTVVDKRKAARTSEEYEDDDEDTVDIERCIHQWKKHWAVYDKEGTGTCEELSNSMVCTCGVVPKEEFDSHRYNIVKEVCPSAFDIFDDGLHWTSPEPYLLEQIDIGLHGAVENIRNRSFEITSVDGATGTASWKFHIEYVDSKYCPRCGMHVTNDKDTPEYWEKKWAK